ncbi:SMI1/KNR4 family protein [Enterococcus sp. BWR-S5]|uniref:SMI1/KNR4 family protein n=1 Tax=Enterococcus sp. BWR-S5 TaxID=2787714 RepID=UPI0019209EAA|nr:SMI1/KNR4 family protein [Enterococcus sp. BWR-S5]MBL1227057.1 SMI1/KNR4 family protein [Enterococcus sp. BWR-S5]
MSNKLTWKYSKGMVTDQEISKVENQLKIKFPKDYIEVVESNDGAYPSLHAFSMNSQEEMLNNLLSFSEAPYINILTTFENMSDRLVDGIIPFGEDAGGNLICFDYRSSEVPTVVFWDHEIAGGGELEKAITSICNNFTEFLNMLHEFVEE